MMMKIMTNVIVIIISAQSLRMKISITSNASSSTSQLARVKEGREKGRETVGQRYSNGSKGKERETQRKDKRKDIKRIGKR